MQGFTGFTESKRAVLAVLLFIIGSAMVFTGKMPIDMWKDYTVTIFLGYAGAETVTKTAQYVTNRKNKGESNAVAKK